MKLRELKKRVYEDWQRRCWYNQAVIQPETFKPEIRQYGDLRCKATWVKAFARFRALNLWDGCLDAYTLITQHFNFVEERWDYEFRFQILEEFLSLPGALEALQTGWEQLFGCDLTTPQEKETAYGLLAMVSRQSEGTGRTAAGTLPLPLGVPPAPSTCLINSDANGVISFRERLQKLPVSQLRQMDFL